MLGGGRMVSSFVCPVCNGFKTLISLCPNCGQSLDDQGRLFDFFSDYSPYRPIDDLKKTDHLPDLANHLCPHQVICSSCNYTDIQLIQEIEH